MCFVVPDGLGFIIKQEAGYQPKLGLFVFNTQKVIEIKGLQTLTVYTVYI